jgi:maleate isomerase
LDEDIASVDPKYLSETLIKLDMNDADALFISCTALPALEILDEVEKKIDRIVFSSNQTLIWDTLRSIGYKSPVKGYGKLLRN